MRTFTLSGAFFLVVGGAAATLVANPTPGLALPAPPPGAASPEAGGRRDFTPAEALRRPQFWSLWAMLFLNVTAGILFISNAVPILRELTGAAPAAAAAAYGAIAVANAIGRFLWGAVSDRIGRRAAYLLIYATQVVLFLAASRVHSLGAASALFAVVLLCYGGGFGTMPSFVADWFGTRHLGVNYGWILSAWGVAGIAGPLFVARVKDLTGSYAGALPWIAGILALAALLPTVTRRPSAS
jgi:MFS family permease